MAKRIAGLAQLCVNEFEVSFGALRGLICCLSLERVPGADRAKLAVWGRGGANADASGYR